MTVADQLQIQSHAQLQGSWDAFALFVMVVSQKILKSTNTDAHIKA